jgi:predicted porin
MKKSLIALAAFAAVASAQADVTIYGNLDPSVVVQKMTTSSGGYTNAIGTSSAMDKSSQLGFKGAEDIGGGMKVIFDLQGDLTLGTGLMGNSNSGNSGAASAAIGGNSSASGVITAPSADVFNRNAYVGLQTNSGTLKVGRQFTPFHEDQVNNDAFGMNSGGFLAVMSQLTTTGAGANGTNFLINQASQLSAFGNGNVGVNSYGSYANGLSFELPAMNGLTLKVFQTIGETALTSTNANKSLPSSSSGITSIKAVYDVNPALKLNAAWQTTRAGVAATSVLPSTAPTGNLLTAENLYINSTTGVTPGQQVFSVAMYGGQYTMGQFRFTLSQASLQQFVAGFDNVGVTHAGVLYSMSPVVDLGLEYTSVKDKTATASTANITAVLGRYKLSKTTYVWGMYNTTGNSGNSVMNGNYSGISTGLTTAGTTNTSFSSGISYSF